MKQITNPRLTEEFFRPELDASLTPPVVRGNPPLFYHPEVGDYVMSGGMAMTPGGRIYLAWFSGGDNDKAVILIAHSDDGGLNFSQPQFILDPGYASCGIHISAVIGNLWTAPDGRLFFFFGTSLDYYDGRAGVWFSICENPDADSPKWSPSLRICDGAALNKPTVLNNGKWLLPVSLWDRRYITLGAASSSVYRELDPQRMANVYESSDQGRTWTRIGGVKTSAPTHDEHMILERQDGSLLMYLRTLKGRYEQCFSFDGGHSWSQPKRVSFSSGPSRFFLRRLQSGRTLLVRCHNPKRPIYRANMTAYLSEDDGKTWPYSLLLDPRGRVSYPDGFQTPDGRIFIQYDRLREHGEILMAIFREEDILAGQLVSQGSILRHPVIQTWSAKHNVL